MGFVKICHPSFALSYFLEVVMNLFCIAVLTFSFNIPLFTLLYRTLFFTPLRIVYLRFTNYLKRMIFKHQKSLENYYLYEFYIKSRAKHLKTTNVFTFIFILDHILINMGVYRMNTIEII